MVRLLKHCHFSILYNEIAFLKQKLPFLYKHFDQLIFFDLNICTYEFSDDGSHEYIKNYPDPENKITLIEKKNLDDVDVFKGYSFIQKRKMFAVGSSYVRDDIDYFWCTDMDEFFSADLIPKVEKSIGEGQSAFVNHLIFYKNARWVLVDCDGNPVTLAWPRITRHKKGTIYGHCGLQDAFVPQIIKDEFLFHFAHVGSQRVYDKSEMYSNLYWFYKVWSKFDENQAGEPGVVVHYPNAHPAFISGLRLNTDKIPSYINVEEMLKDLKVTK